MFVLEPIAKPSHTDASVLCKVLFFFFCEGAPQLMLRTHHSLKAYCATPVMKMKMSSFQVLQVMEH
jgi:hypothetical protein